MRGIKLLPVFLAVAMILTLTHMTCMPVSAVKGSYPGTNGKIAFNAPYAEYGDEEIYVMNADGTGQALLNVNGDEPNWSPDGAKIVFSTGVDSVWIMNADGSGELELTEDMPEALSPDWQRLPGVSPVGGFMEPADKLAILAPWLTIVGSVAAISVVIVASWKKPENQASPFASWFLNKSLSLRVASRLLA